MTDLTAAFPRLAFRLDLGRNGAAEVELGVVLAVLALIGLAVAPAVGTPGAVLFLAAGCILIASRPGPVLALAFRAWPVVLLAAFCTLSFTWSREPALSLRFGLQLAATAAIALAICQRLGPRSFCLCLALLLGGAMAASLVAGGTSGESNAWTGIYGSKNAFAGAAATFTILALGLALGPGNLVLRAAALVAGAGGIGLAVLAQSAGTLVLLTLTLAVTGLLLVAPRLGRAHAAAVFAFIALIGTALVLLATANVREISAFLLDATGKDLTLTGRTELWAVAEVLIAERPLFGVGYQAFWVPGNAEAEALWHMFGIESRSGFNFHNMYLSNAVEIGVLGVGLQALILLGAGVFTALWTLRTGAPVAATLFALTFMAILGSVIEVPVFFQFSLRTVLVIAAFHYAREALVAGR